MSSKESGIDVDIKVKPKGFERVYFMKVALTLLSRIVQRTMVLSESGVWLCGTVQPGRYLLLEQPASIAVPDA